MKKQVAASIILLILTTLILPASRLLGKGKVGIKAGMLTSNILVRWYESWTLKSLRGFEVGGFYTCPITPSFYLQTEINYSTEGFQYYDVYSRGFEPIKFKLIKIPLLLNCTFKNDPVEFFTGPYIAFRIGKEKYGEPHSISFDGKIEKTDLGLALGLRINLKKIFRNFFPVFFEFHGNLGLKSFIKEYPPDKKQLRRSLAFMVGYRF